jgi:hypothetical protein
MGRGYMTSVKPAETEVTPLEQAARDAYVVELEAQAGAVTDPGVSREIQIRARRCRDALPIAEMFDRLRKIAQAKDDLPPGGGLDALRLRGGLDDSAIALREQNVYPPLLLELFKRYQESGPKLNPAFYVNDDSSETDRASVAAAVDLLGLDAAEKAGNVSQRERVEKAVAEAMSPLGTKINLVRRELADYRAEQIKAGARFE